MRRILCTDCGTAHSPLAESYALRGKLVCRACAAKRMVDAADPVPASDIQPLTDPTICADCRKDRGDRAWPDSNGRHLCRECRAHWKRIQFPIWVRLACTVCLLAGSCGFLHSLRLARGIHAYRQGIAAFLDDDYAKAAEDLHRARGFMPKDEHFEDLEAFYRGHACLEEGNAREAARQFQISLDLDPDSPTTAHMLYVAQRRAAFKEGKYEAYFRASEALLELDGHTPQALLAMASAWACRFVQSGQDECRQQALACLKQAHEAGGKDADNWMLEGWVNLMLEKRTIMSFLDYRLSIGKGDNASEDFG